MDKCISVFELRRYICAQVRHDNMFVDVYRLRDYTGLLSSRLSPPLVSCTQLQLHMVNPARQACPSRTAIQLSLTLTFLL